MCPDNSFYDNLFQEDSYDTPENTKRFLTDRMVLGNRFSFYARNFAIFTQTGRYAKMGMLDKTHQIKFSYGNVKVVEGCGGRIHLRGLNNLSKFQGPAMLIGNHMSLLETAIFHAFVRPRRDITFVIKKSLLDVPFFGNIMRSLEAIAIGRANPKDDFKIVMSEGKRLLEKGKSIILFPQSTRSENFEPENFNTIGIKLARAAKVPVIPFALKTDFLENGRWLRDLGPVRREKNIFFEFAEPIMEISGNGKDEHNKIIEFISAKVAEWKEYDRIKASQK
jgi:1-acyl-sn-glycerol-3-phosphate acyltransferase